MNGFISNAVGKLARFAVSKAAAFSYAVAVGVAGNLVFHFVQPAVPIPAVLMPPAETSQPAEKQRPPEPAATAAIAPKPAVAPLPEPPGPAPVSPPAPSATVAAPPVPPPKPALAYQPAETRAPNPPDAATLSAPSWKPLTLPGVPQPSEATVRAVPTAPTEPALVAPSSVGSLPPLGPAIEVATPPTPPERRAAALPPAAAPLPPAHPATDEMPTARSWELSDVWHPYRAVRKGLNWAGEQVPVIGGDGAEPQPPKRHPEPTPAAAVRPVATPPKQAVSADPIPLLPTKPELADAPGPAPAKPVAPGPGSGGLY